MKWFGADWGAPVCRETPQVLTPDGDCFMCRDPIVSGDRGFVMPHVTGTPEAPSVVEHSVHFECLMLNVGAIKVLHILHQGFALCGLQGVPVEWPEGHRWVPLERKRHATCAACKRVAEEVGA